MSIELVWDKSDCTLELDGLTIVAAPRTNPPFTYQAVVEEQDTHLILSEQTILKDPGKPAWYLANTLEQEKPQALGSVIIKGQTPQRLLAVVHDIEQDPTCHPDIIKQAYTNVLQLIEKRNIQSLALPLLGTVHGKLTVTESTQLLGDRLQQSYPASLQRLWLILPPGSGCSVIDQLKTQT